MSDFSSGVAELSNRFSGRLLLPKDPEWSAARRVHNGLVDKRPALVAQCLGSADIASAVRFARDHGLEIAVRGGGHNVGGRATVDGGLMIDLSLMKHVHVDPARRIARAAGGTLWGHFNRETQAHGLATTGGVVSTTGVAGLTLGGGVGWLMPKHGMALDNLPSFDVVLADGRMMRASADEHPEQLSDEATDTIIDRFMQCPSPMGQLVIESFHGAATRVAPADTAYALRASGLNILVVSQSMAPADDTANIAWARDSYAALQPFVGARRYVNYLDQDDDGDPTLAAAYGPNFRRLQSIKAKYDPDNAFHLNVNIPPKL